MSQKLMRFHQQFRIISHKRKEFVLLNFLNSFLKVKSQKVGLDKYTKQYTMEKIVQ